MEGFERVRTREAAGHAAVRHMLRQAAGLESTEHGLSYAGAISAACLQAKRFGTSSEELEELFGLARATAVRSESETELSAPNSTRASRQIEALSAERILEEELVAFQAAAANDQSARSSAPAPRPSLPPYSAEELGSSVRLRIAPFSLLPLPARQSSGR